MLTDAILTPGAMALVARTLSGASGPPKRLQKGVYQVEHFSFELEIRNRQAFHLDCPPLSRGFDIYGVCDSVEQLIGSLPEEVTEGHRFFCLAVTPIRKADQPAEGGWRWKKWGPYIGTKQPATEYLYDEPLIDEVLCYHLHELLPTEVER